MTVRWYSVVIDCVDIRRVSGFWAAALDWRVAYEADDELVLVPPRALTAEGQAEPPLERGPGLVFVQVPEAKSVKNRLHIDLAPLAGDDHEAEVQRLLDLGATRADVGQQDAAWVVLADPEGNEFCVLTPRD